MSTVVIYHNPRCSKSRATLQLLEQRGIAPTVVEYLNQPPTAEQLRQILDLLDKTPREIMRRKEAEYQANNLDDAGLSDDQLISAITANPKLLERPIVLANGKAAIGRPPESVLNIL
jgi:arsenate reductase